MDPFEQKSAEQDPKGHENRTQDPAGDNCRCDSRLHLGILFCSEIPGHDNRTSDVAAEGKSQKNQRDFITVSDRRQRIFTDKPTGHKTVSDVIKLLKYNASEQRQAELP